eukprot:gene8376-9232_t
MEATEDQFDEILKQTEAILTEARLNQIAKENKSIGAILDTRQLYPIEDVYVRTKKAIQQEIDNRIHSRRGGRGERDIKPQAALVLEAFREKGVHVDLLSGSYELELGMWKNNARKAAYAEQRKYKYPELHAFLKNMDARQKSNYKERMGAHLIRVCEELREECRVLKSEMDLNGIFHPEANSHRVHCIYIMKLHKKITPENIDDFILRKMYQEYLVKMKADAELAQQKEQILQSITLEEEFEKNRKQRQRGFLRSPNSNGNGSPPRSPAKSPSRMGSPSQSLSRLGDKGSSKMSPGRSSSSKLVGQETMKGNSMGPKRKTVATLHPVARNKSIKGVPAPSSQESAVKGSVTSSVHITKTSLLSAVGGSNTDSQTTLASPTRKNPSSSKLFNKLTRPEKMGFLDSSSLLREEANRFSMTETVLTRKPRDKNNILEEKISSWMLHGIQHQQIEKAATRSTTIIPNDRTIWAAASEKVLASSHYSPSKVLPFDEYYTLLKEVQQGDDERRPPTADSVNSVASSSTNKQARGQQTVESKPITSTNTGGVVNSTLKDSSTLNRSSSVSIEETKPVPTASINLIKHFTEHDKNFEAYLKIAELEQPSAKLFAKLNNSKLIKPKKIRRMAPLGRDAVQLLDSRGRASKLAMRGFVNVFRVASKKSRGKSAGENGNGGEEGDGEDTSTSGSSSSSDREEGSVMERLEGVDLEEDGASSVASSNTSLTAGFDADGSSRAGRSRSRRRLMASMDGSSIQTSNSSRKRSGVTFDDGLDSILYPPLTEADLDLQVKLQATWDSLQMSATHRLAFMAKYSTQVYASEMSRAIDLWADAAVLLIVFKEAVNIRHRMQTSALTVAAMKPDILMHELFRDIHPLLASRSPMLIPVTSVLDRSRSQQGESSRSAMSVIQTRQMARDFISAITTLPITNKEGSETKSQDNTDETELLIKRATVFASEIGAMALRKLETVERVLTDEIHLGNKIAKEWLLAQDVMKTLT